MKALSACGRRIIGKRIVQRILERFLFAKVNNTISKELAFQSIALDSSILELNLQLSFEERIDAHENARQLMVDLSEAGRKWYGKSQIPS
jgi:hypothetical protein